MAKNIIFLVFLFAFSILTAQERQMAFENYGAEQGLKTTMVQSVIQDNAGYIWCGTIHAIHRFDGFNFKTYQNEAYKKKTVSTGVVNRLYEDSRGNFWVGATSGLNKFDRVTGDFIQIGSVDPSVPIFKYYIQTIYEDSKGVLWIGAMMGLSNLDSTGTKLQPFIPKQMEQVIPNIAFNSIVEDNQGFLWFGTGIGILKYDRTTNNIIPVWIDPEPPAALMSKTWNTGTYAVRSIYKDNDGNLWFGSFGGGLMKLNTATGLTKIFVLSDNISGEKFPVTSICREDENTLWIGTYNGLLLVNKSDGLILNRYTYDENIKDGLSDNKVACVMKDKSGSLWIGSLKGGLDKLNRTKYQFKNFVRKSWVVDKSTALVPLRDMIVGKSGSVFVGTAEGIEEINPHTNEIKKRKPFEAINVLMEDSRGNFWIAIKQYSGGGFYKKDINETLYPVLDSAGSKFTKEIQCLYESKKGKIYFGSEFYLFEVEPATNKAVLVFKTNRRLYCLTEDKDGTLCIGTMAGGLFFFNQDTKTVIRHFTPDANDPNSIRDYNVTSLCLDSKNNLWAGTGMGIGKYVKELDGFKSYDENNGLDNNVVMEIVEDNSGNLWIGTTTGISKFNPETETFKNYDMGYGLVETYHYAGGKTKNGELFFKAKSGITYFHPDSITNNTFIPPVVITEMKVHNNPYPFDKEVTLSYSQNYISLEYAALSYISPDKNKYAYMMEGIDKDWIYPENRRYASYTDLDPGKYIFHVKASNNDGVWNETGTSLNIIIAPPWYRTYWAYGLYVIIFISLVYSWRRYDLRRRDLKYQIQLEHESAQKEKEISHMKSRFFTNISHEFRTPLTLIIGPAEDIISSSPDTNVVKKVGLMKKNADHLLGLVNQLLDISKLDEGKLKIQVSKGNIVLFVKGIVSIFESGAESKDIELEVIPEKENIEGYFDKEKLEKSLINIISNALKFTPEGGKITIAINETEERKVLIIIKDTGIGIEKTELPKLFDRFYQVDSSHTREHGGTGIGLALTKELIELHHGKISVDSSVGEWTEFIIELPIELNNYQSDEILKITDEKPDDAKYFNISEQIDKELENFERQQEIFISEKTTAEIEGEKQIILVVEDNKDVRDYIKDSLEGDFTIKEAANGEQGYRKAEAIIPDLIIGDIMMPKMDGYEMTKKIREDEKTFHIPIILLTAKSDHKSKLEGFEKGADAYIVKPFDMNELKIRIQNLIEIRKKLQEKFARGEKIPFRGKETKLSDLNVKFINKAIAVMEKHIEKEEFSIEEFGKELYMSRTQLHRKLKALTGKSASRYLRSFRLNAAKKMIEEKKGTISEIAYNVGFSSPIYFSKCFRDEYGYSPSEATNNK